METINIICPHCGSTVGHKSENNKIVCENNHNQWFKKSGINQDLKKLGF